MPDVCEICNEGPLTDGRTVHRVNAPGEMPPRWRCTVHLSAEQDAAIDPVVRDIVEIIERETERAPEVTR